MAKGYWIAHVDIGDAEGYREYQAANGVAFQKYGGVFIVRGGACEIPEGAARSRHVIIEFPNYAAARDCYHSAEYQAAKARRMGKGLMDLVIVEGYAG